VDFDGPGLVEGVPDHEELGDVGHGGRVAGRGSWVTTCNQKGVAANWDDPDSTSREA
jgi:hypothetical protein